MSNKAKIYLDEDNLLMIKVSAGDGEAYNELCSKYFSSVVSFVTSLNGWLQSPEDIAQEVFYRIWKKRKAYRPRAAFKTYLFDFAGKVFSEERKRLSKELILYKRLIDQNHDCELVIFQQKAEIYLDEMIQAAADGISELTFKERQAVELYYFREMSMDEASVQADCSLAAFEGRLRRARRQLGRLLGV